MKQTVLPNHSDMVFQNWSELFYDNNIFIGTKTLIFLFMYFFRHVGHLNANPETPWNAPADQIQQAQNFVTNELVISGIYVRLFIANPGWVLRKPREFLSDLLEQALQSMKSSNPNLEALETITTALVKLLEAQPALADMVPATGYISRILSSISSLDSNFQKSGVLVINTLSR